MEPSIRKNWLVAVFFGVIGICACVLVVDFVARVRHGMMLMQTHNDLKWIVIALHDYHDAHGHFPPPVIRDDDGSAVHSWRSVIQDELRNVAKTKDRFDAYDLSQPWDAPTNRESSSQHRFGSHPYRILAVVGHNAAWHPTRTRSIADFTDGTSNTVLLIAVRNSDCAWHEPVDAVVNESGKLTINNEDLDLSSDVFLVTADGTVRCAANGVPTEILSALLTINAGDTVGDWQP